MATTLAAQLQHLKQLQGPSERHFRGKASLLFDHRRAADIDAESIYGIALTGEWGRDGRSRVAEIDWIRPKGRRATERGRKAVAGGCASAQNCAASSPLLFPPSLSGLPPSPPPL